MRKKETIVHSEIKKSPLKHCKWKRQKNGPNSWIFEWELGCHISSEPHKTWCAHIALPSHRDTLWPCDCVLYWWNSAFFPPSLHTDEHPVCVFVYVCSHVHVWVCVLFQYQENTFKNSNPQIFITAGTPYLKPEFTVRCHVRFDQIEFIVHAIHQLGEAVSIHLVVVAVRKHFLWFILSLISSLRVITLAANVRKSSIALTAYIYMHTLRV